MFLAGPLRLIVILMKYPPRDPDDVVTLIDQNPLCWLVSAGAAGFGASPLPLLAECDADGSLVALLGHMAIANPQVALLRQQPSALVLVNGPQAYISPELLSNPTWVPTWNYAAATVQVDVVFVPEETGESIERLTERMGDQALVRLRRVPTTPAPREQLARADSAVVAILSGTVARPVLTGKAEDLDRLQGDLSLIASAAQAENTLRMVQVQRKEVATSNGAQAQGRLQIGRVAQIVMFFLTILLAGLILSHRVEDKTNRPIESGTLYLVDSGGQYRDGTTDVTRTLAIGTPTREMQERFTLVLKGHVALVRAVFPVGTRGGQLDILARQYLWAQGLDYAHGTGHGVGSFLSVHEGPQRIATFGGGDEPLQAGMILSNEPGYYKTGAYGIRIENLVLVEERAVPGAEKPMLGFETLTFAPIDRALIATDMLSVEEQAWIDRYHAQVLDVVGPQLEGDALAWLKAACAPLTAG